MVREPAMTSDEVLAAIAVGVEQGLDAAQLLAVYQKSHPRALKHD